MHKLPRLKSKSFTWNGKIGYQGSIIKRSIDSTIGIYRHWGFIYGFDKYNNLLIIENNTNGVECVHFEDFINGNKQYVIEHLQNPEHSRKIIVRAKRRSRLQYDERKNNCEHFAKYCVHGLLKSIQVEVTEKGVDILLTFFELMGTLNQNTEIRDIIRRQIDDARNLLELPLPKEILKIRGISAVA